MVQAIRDTLLNYVNAVEQQLAGAKPAAPKPSRRPRSRRRQPTGAVRTCSEGPSRSAAAIEAAGLGSADPRAAPGTGRRPMSAIDHRLASSHPPVIQLDRSTRHDPARSSHRRDAMTLDSDPSAAPRPRPAAPPSWSRRRLRRQATESDDAVVVPEPRATHRPPRRQPPPAGGRRLDDGRAARPRRRRTAPAGRRRCKAEGWGTLKGQVVFGGDPPDAQGPRRPREGRQGSRGLRQGRPDPVGAAGRRRRDQGGQERPRLHPQADRRQRRGQDGRRDGPGRLRPEEVRLRAARPGAS